MQMARPTTAERAPASTELHPSHIGSGRRIARALLALVLPLVLVACGADDVTLERSGGAAPLTADPAVEAPAEALPDPSTSAVPTTLAPPTSAAPPATSAPPTTVPIPRVVVDTAFVPFATIDQVVLVHPSAQVELVGFHEANHDGARQMEPTAEAARAIELESRQRGTGSRSAADIVVPPDAEIRSPVTGTVKRAGGYILYCEHDDDFAVIEPDARPGWEVKVLHIDGVQVQAGQRVEAGVTVLAPRSTPLPFASQVDDHTASPAWPHVHVEVVDISIPNRPPPGGGGGC
jgi:murein DD-endopeptidase MepM/ murein hydrolase activator NlpD